MPSSFLISSADIVENAVLQLIGLSVQADRPARLNVARPE